MQIWSVSFVTVATCLLLLSLTDRSLASNRGDSLKRSSSGSSSVWTRLKRRVSRKKSSPKAARYNGKDALETGSHGSSGGSTPSESDNHGETPTKEENTEHGVGDPSLSGVDRIVDLQRKLKLLAGKIGELERHRTEHRGLRLLYTITSRPETLVSLREQCKQILALKQQIQELSEELTTAINSEPGPPANQVSDAFSLQLESLLIEVRMDDAAFSVTDDWCLENEDTGSPDGWWAAATLKEMQSEALKEQRGGSASTDESDGEEGTGTSTDDGAAIGLPSVAEKTSENEPAPPAESEDIGSDFRTRTGSTEMEQAGSFGADTTNNALASSSKPPPSTAEIEEDIENENGPEGPDFLSFSDEIQL